MEQPRINYLNSFLLVNQEPSIGKLRVLSLQSFASLYGSSPVVERTSYDTIHTLCILSQYGRIAVGTQTLAKALCIESLTEAPHDYIVTLQQSIVPVDSVYFLTLFPNRSRRRCRRRSCHYGLLRYGCSSGCNRLFYLLLLGLLISSLIGTLARLSRCHTTD